MALWIVATPLGTLGDLSPRAREVLGAASVIAAEDTRTTRALLSAVDIAAPPLVALHAHNEAQQADGLARRALLEEVVLVSDAGTPAVSDPGRALVDAALRLGVELRSVPGPSALAAALAASGLPASPSTFVGFPPRRGRGAWCRELLARPETLVIYEAPTRVAELTSQLAALAPARRAVLCREISKRHEEIVGDALGDLAANLEARETIRGECVLVVGPGEALAAEVAEVEDTASLKQIAAALATRWGVSKKEAYDRLLRLERGEDDA